MTYEKDPVLIRSASPLSFESNGRYVKVVMAGKKDLLLIVLLRSLQVWQLWFLLHDWIMSQCCGVRFIDIIVSVIFAVSMPGFRASGLLSLLVVVCKLVVG